MLDYVRNGIERLTEFTQNKFAHVILLNPHVHESFGAPKSNTNFNKIYSKFSSKGFFCFNLENNAYFNDNE